MPAPDDALEQSISTPSVPPPTLPPPDFGGPNALMDGYRAEADELQKADDARPRDASGRFLPTKEPVETPSQVVEPPSDETVEAPKVEPPKVSFGVAMAARQAGLPQEWIDRAPSDEFLILALRGLNGPQEPATASESHLSAADIPKKLQLAINEEQFEPEVVAVLKNIVSHVNEVNDAYAARMAKTEQAYGALEAANSKLHASVAQSAARQEAGVLDSWVVENPQLAERIGRASEALGQLDGNGYPTTEKAFRWRQLAQKAGNPRLDTPAGRAQLAKAAKELWPDVFQGLPPRNEKGSLPPGASIRPAAKGGESPPRNSEEAELRRMEDAFAEVGARDANDWYVKTGGKPLPV